MADDVNDIYYDIEAAVSVLTCLDTFDAKTLMSNKDEQQLKKDAIYVIRRCIRSLAESWEQVPES